MSDTTHSTDHAKRRTRDAVSRLRVRTAGPSNRPLIARLPEPALP